MCARYRFREIGKRLHQRLIEQLSIALLANVRAVPKRANANTYIYRLDFGVHELVLSGGSFETVFGQMHRIASIVDVSEHLHRHARCEM